MACENPIGNSSAYQYNYNNSNCTPRASNCDVINASNVLYTGGDLSCIAVPTNSTLSEVLLLLAAAICEGGAPNPDYSGYNTYCLRTGDNQPITTQQEFVESSSELLCTIKTDLNTFIDSTFVSSNANLQNQINAIKNPAITSCGALGIVSGDQIGAVLTKLSNGVCSILTSINPSSANWNSCYTISAPTTIVGGFNAVLSMICDIKSTVAAGLTLPTFNNVGSCLPTPLTTTDSLVTTINKIKSKLCTLPTFDYTLLNYNCVDSATTLQNTIQNIIDFASDLKQNSVLTFDPSYFIVTNIDDLDLCQGKQVTLDVTSLDRNVAANNSDSSPGTLINKLQGTANQIVVDDTTTAGKVTLSLHPSVAKEDVKVKVSNSDPQSSYLINKLEGTSTGEISINVYEDAVTNPSSHVAKITPIINWQNFAETLLLAINGDSYLKSLFCQIDCNTVPTAYYKLEVTNTGPTTLDFSVDLDQTTPPLSIHSATTFTVSGTSTYNPTPVAVTASSTPIGATLTLTNTSSVSVSFNYSTRDNANLLITGGSSGSGTLAPGGTITPGFTFGTSPDDYRLVINIQELT